MYVQSYYVKYIKPGEVSFLTGTPGKLYTSSLFKKILLWIRKSVHIDVSIKL